MVRIYGPYVYGRIFDTRIRVVAYCDCALIRLKTDRFKVLPV